MAWESIGLRLLFAAVTLGWGAEALVDAAARAVTIGYTQLGTPAPESVSTSSLHVALAAVAGEGATHLALTVGLAIAVFGSGFVASAVSVGAHHGRLKRDRRAPTRAGRRGGMGPSGLALVLVSGCSVGVVASAARAGLAAAGAVLPLVIGWLIVVTGLFGGWFVGQGVLRHGDRGTREGADDPTGTAD